MRLPRNAILLLIALAAFSVVVACSSDDDEVAPTAAPAATSTPEPVDEDRTIKIGLLSPETGPIAQFAPGFADASSVAMEELNAEYPGFQFELITVDSGCDGTQAATAAQSLVDAGVSVIVGAACSGATLGAIAVTAPAGIPMVSYASTSPAITTADDDGYLFRIVPSDAQQAVALTDVLSSAGVSNPAVLAMTNDYGAGLGDNFASNWDGSLCSQVGYDPTEGSYDASTLAQAVVDGGCDSVVLMSYGTDGAAIVEALVSQGFDGSIFGADGISDSAFQNDFTDVSALDNVVATRPRQGEDSSAKADFETAYAAAGGSDGAIYTHETYDAIKFVAAAIVSDPDGDLVAALNATGKSYVGASGTHTFDVNGDVLGTGYSVCDFSVSGSSVSFGCPQIWTADGGLATDTDIETTTIKIGLLSPETGPIAQFAPGFADASAVAMEEINAAYPGFQFELITVDSGCDGTQAATAAQSLVDAGVTAIVGAACSGATLGAIAVTAPAGIPMVSYASTSPAITNADDDGLLFRIVPSDAQQAVALTDVLSGAGVSNPAVLAMTNDYGAGLGDNFASNWAGDLCTQVGYDPTEGSYDASTLAQSVVDGGCDSVVLMSYGTDGAAIVEALIGQGFDGSIFGADGISDSAFQNDFTDVSALDNVVATRPRQGEESSAKADFESAYSAAGGSDGAIYTHETYDAIKFVAAAIVSSQGGDLQDALNATGDSYVGASGTHTFDSNGDVLGTGYSVCEFGVSGSDVAFDCPQIWTADGGLSTP
ncbi:MAG: ABC transporter substrate-binding protein [Chloroflexi bacterium]|jgi:branched-chain amino acid transport system substrate-binding protein|nr:ABC transporter substrate-binding protein [Chloroflexota bacterium]MBT4072407.1 ABC transporter substrate-binding protein [Chloroflexota bacterium]MBT4514003.1 ABC transporter substrate-binding protein [Chloroflexota bacterium]MBT6683129.1 ABC transporter substrate-binding protein [Chloroflexota bacterium]